MKLVSLLVVAAFAVVASAQSLPSLNVSQAHVTVSGLSSGGFMAVQMHVAYSSLFTGAGVLAGGPFWCAQGELTDAFMECMYATLPIPLPTIYSQMQTYYSQGLIDDPKNLTSSPVYLFSGTMDFTVNQKVMKSLQTFYQHFGANVATEFNLEANHCWPTENYGNPCWELKSPFMSKCNYEASDFIVKQVLGSQGVKIVKGTSNNSNLKSFSQGPYNSGGISMADTGYVYIPTACQKDASKCLLHVALHGCEQDVEAVGMDFVENTGLNDWAEGSGIIVLYPQVKKSLFDPTNDMGCWDWWGYSGSDYATQKGPQVKAVYGMMQTLFKA